MITQQEIYHLTVEELSSFLASLGYPAYRAVQVFEWLYQKGVEDFGRMTSLPKSLRETLKEHFSLRPLTLRKKNVSADGTTKFLFDLDDHQKIESVLIPASGRMTVCLSSQAGCKFGCRFCASGIGGWKRDLTSAEILKQILFVRKSCGGRKLTHVVFMGVGEPLDNYGEVLKAVKIINRPCGLNIAARRITVSTCGLIPQIRTLAREHIQTELSVSLHGFDETSRSRLMPVNKRYPLKDLMKVCREYIKKTRRQITFEYILIRDLTCTEKAARELAKNLKGMICKLNLIPYNPVKEFPHKPSTLEEMRTFQRRLKAVGLHATLRLPRGRDIAAACGQLRHRVQNIQSMT